MNAPLSTLIAFAHACQTWNRKGPLGAGPPAFAWSVLVDDLCARIQQLRQGKGSGCFLLRGACQDASQNTGQPSQSRSPLAGIAASVQELPSAAQGAAPLLPPFRVSCDLSVVARVRGSSSTHKERASDGTSLHCLDLQSSGLGERRC